MRACWVARARRRCHSHSLAPVFSRIGLLVRAISRAVVELTSRPAERDQLSSAEHSPSKTPLGLHPLKRWREGVVTISVVLTRIVA